MDRILARKEMMVMNTCLIMTYFLFIFGTHVAFCQPMQDADLNNMLEIAEERVLNHDYINALTWYEKCYDLSPNESIALHMARVNRQLRDYESAAKWFDVSNQLDRKLMHPESRLEYAQMLKMSGRTSEAREAFLFFEDMNKHDHLNKMAALELQGLEIGKENPLDGSLTLQALPTTINTRFSETSPFFIDDQTITYAGFDPALVADYQKQRKINFTSHIYKSSIGLDNGYDISTKLIDIPSEDRWHVSNLTMAENGELRGFMYSYLRGNEVIKSKFAVQEKSGEEWSEIYYLDDLGEELLVKHLSFGYWQNRQAIFFDVNLDNGKGKRDIYYAWYQGHGKISNPVNLIGPVNTTQDEITPFYIKDKLYFSSDGHPSIGGFDIFVSDWDGQVWSQPYNLGPSTNSFADDFYFVTDKRQSKALFVSNRPEGNSFKSKTCCDDIYLLTYGHEQRAKEESAKGIVLNESVLLPNIYFDFNDDQLNQSASSDLNLVKNLMDENPTWIIEIASHTDSRGEKSFNIDLSTRRATNARQFLIDNGIRRDRITAKGYGEEFILNKCTDGVSCSEGEHRYNRRIEFSLIGLVQESVNQIPEKPKGLPIMTFKSSFHDFGTLKKGRNKTHIYPFTNTGSGDLIIELATACECTTLKWPQDPIPPGGSGELKVTYDSTEKMGEEEITIDIITNTKSVVEEARFRVFVIE